MLKEADPARRKVLPATGSWRSLGRARTVTHAALGCLAWVSCLGASASGHAAAASSTVQRVAVVRVTHEGAIPPGAQQAFADHLVEGLAVAEFQVISGPTVARRLEAKHLTCNDSDCYPKLASTLDVGYLVVGHVAESNKTYDITLEIINGRTGATIGRRRERCETCGMTEAAEKVGLAASALRSRLEALARTPARVVVRSRPGGAEASIDGQPVGRTPIDLELTGGQHHLALRLRGYHDVARTFTVVSGVDEALELEMLRPPSTFPYRLVGWLALAGGAALVGGGAYAAAIDGSELACAEEVKDVRGRCPRLRDTDALAATLVGVGAASMALGGVAVWVATQQSRTDGDSPSVSLVGLRVSGRF